MGGRFLEVFSGTPASMPDWDREWKGSMARSMELHYSARMLSGIHRAHSLEVAQDLGWVVRNFTRETREIQYGQEA